MRLKIPRWNTARLELVGTADAGHATRSHARARPGSWSRGTQYNHHSMRTLRPSCVRQSMLRQIACSSESPKSRTFWKHEQTKSSRFLSRLWMKRNVASDNPKNVPSLAQHSSSQTLSSPVHTASKSPKLKKTFSLSLSCDSTSQIRGPAPPKSTIRKTVSSFSS